MSEQLTPKSPADTVAYVIDWRQQLGSDPNVAPDQIQTYTLTVTSGTVTLPFSENLGLAIHATVAGGFDGETATLNCQVNTYGGQVLIRTLSLLVSSTAISVTPETTTKRTVIAMAFEELGLADYEFNTTNEEKASALRRLDSLMALWAGPGFNLDLGYNFPPSIGQGALIDPAGIPDDTLDAVSAHLAAKLAPVIGKSLSPETRTTLNRSLNALRTQYAVIPDRLIPSGTIRGAGAKPWGVWRPFFGDPNAHGTTSSGTAPTLGTLSVSPGSATAGAAYDGTISGATTGSTITATSSDGTVLTVGGAGSTRTLSGTFASAGTPTIILTETLTGAANTPHVTAGTITVSAVGVINISFDQSDPNHSLNLAL